MSIQFYPHNNIQYKTGPDRIVLKAVPHSDLIADPTNGQITANAGFLAVPITGDFTIRAKISHRFLSLYDAGCLLAYENESLWAKVCFECSSPETHTAVSVMTNGLSDDSNAADIPEYHHWFQLARKGATIAVHRSNNGIDWIFVRILSLAFSETVQVGFLAQSPLGEGGDFFFDNYQILRQAPVDMRTNKFQ